MRYTVVSEIIIGTPKSIPRDNAVSLTACAEGKNTHIYTKGKLESQYIQVSLRACIFMNLDATFLKFLAFKIHRKHVQLMQYQRVARAEYYGQFLPAGRLIE